MKKPLRLLKILYGGGATAGLPTELVSARQAYQVAMRGPVGALAPVQLESARLALEAANRAFADQDPEAARTLASIAERRTQLAVIHAQQAQQIEDEGSTVPRTRTASAG